MPKNAQVHDKLLTLSSLECAPKNEHDRGRWVRLTANHCTYAMFKIDVVPLAPMQNVHEREERGSLLFLTEKPPVARV